MQLPYKSRKNCTHTSLAVCRILHELHSRAAKCGRPVGRLGCRKPILIIYKNYNLTKFMKTLRSYHNYCI